MTDEPRDPKIHDGDTIRAARPSSSGTRRAAGAAAATGDQTPTPTPSPTPSPTPTPTPGSVSPAPGTPGFGSTTHVTDAALMTAAAIGKQLGPYVLKEELGRGGMGVVYLADDPSLKREVALKVMLAAEFASERERRRFQREAEAAAGLRHPNIIGVHDIGDESGRLFFTMDAVRGLTLRDFIRRKQPPLERAVNVMVRVCDAVGYAHARGIIHRDLKPANILIDETDTPHIMDFGLAKRMTPRDDETFTSQDGAVLGTPHYMSPEQAAGKVDKVDVRSDIYALGVLLYEIATGDVPFRADTLAEMVRLLQTEEPPPARSRNPTIPRDLEVIIAKAMAKEPERRYWTAYALQADLLHWLRHEPINARRASFLYRSRKWIERNRLISVAVLAAAVAGTTVTSYVRYSRMTVARDLIARAREDREQAQVVRREVTGKQRPETPDAGVRERLERDVIGRLDDALGVLGRAQSDWVPASMKLEIETEILLTRADRLEARALVTKAVEAELAARERLRAREIEARLDEAEGVLYSRKPDEVRRARSLYREVLGIDAEHTRATVGQAIADARLACLDGRHQDELDLIERAAERARVARDKADVAREWRRCLEELGR